MRFSVQNDVLVKSLRDVNNAVASRVVQPILSSVLIESAQESRLHFIGTDLDLSIECTCPGAVEDPGAVALPGKRLMEIVSRLPDDLTEFSIDKDTQETTIKCGRSKFVLSGLPASDFPKPSHRRDDAGGSNGMVMPAEILRRSIQQTCFAAASYEMGSVLSGVYLQITDGVFEATATDGSRLANRKEIMRVEVTAKERIGVSEAVEQQARQQVKEQVKEQEGSAKKSKTATLERPVALNAIVPARACTELLKLIDSKETSEVRVSQADGVISFETENSHLASRLVGGEYPRYRELLPVEYTYLSSLIRKDFLSAIERVSIMSDERTHLVKLHFESDSLQITANTPDVGKAQEEVPIKFEGQVLDVSLNVRYLQDVLQRMSNDEIRMEMNGPLKPIIIKGADEENYQYLLMPVQSR